MKPYTSNIINYKNSGLIKFQKYRPRTYIIESTNDSMSYQYINSITDLNLIVDCIYGSPTIDLTTVIKLFGEHNILISNDIILELSIDEIDSVKEYNRDRHIYCSKRSPKQYDELQEDIKQHGIVSPGSIRLAKNNNEISIILGEGNHRLSIAKKLGLSHMPIKVKYTL